jgi:hypothetical protein
MLLIWNSPLKVLRVVLLMRDFKKGKKMKRIELPPIYQWYRDWWEGLSLLVPAGYLQICVNFDGIFLDFSY